MGVLGEGFKEGPKGGEGEAAVRLEEGDGVGEGDDHGAGALGAVG